MLSKSSVYAGFDAEVRKANQSDIGKRNGGAMLSMQVCLLGVGVGVEGRGLTDSLIASRLFDPAGGSR
jgi:hypothetical protein